MNIDDIVNNIVTKS